MPSTPLLVARSRVVATAAALGVVATLVAGACGPVRGRTRAQAAPTPASLAAGPAAAVPAALSGDTTGLVAPGAGPGPSLVWERRLPGVTFRESSPVDANLGRRGFVVGALDGKVYAFDAATGADVPGWPVRTVAPINASPAAAPLDGSGRDDIVVGSGWADAGRCTGGGVYVLRADGSPVWTRAGDDPLCGAVAFHSSPAVGDITGSGTPAITIGALGLQSWSWSATGQLNAGWPYWTDDTVFATPALADLTGSGIADVVMGGDASPGGEFRPGHRGGVVRAVRGDGHTLWQFFTDEIVRSSPVVGPLGRSRAPSIVFGTGNYWINQPGGARDASKVFALDAAGHLQWATDLGAETVGSPALADVTGTGQRDVVIGTADGPSAGRVWVLGPNGAPLPQWAGVPSGGGVVIGGISTADLNGDGAQDLLVPTGAGVYAYDGRTARLLWAVDPSEVGFQSTPLVTTDPDGQVGITVAGTTADGLGVVQHWAMPAASAAVPGALGWPTFHHDARRTGNVAPPPLSDRQCHGSGINGYWEVARDGGVFGSCGAAFFGAPTGSRLASPVVAVTSSPSGRGYWEAAADGGVFAFGDAPFLGSAAGAHPRAPIVAMARTPDGHGYWLVSADGGVFAFGDAPYKGSAGGVRLPFPVVAILPTPSGRGYWLVGSRGSVLTYGDAAFFGAPNGIPLTSPIVGGASSPSGQGYWLAAADGGVFTYGDARFLGSVGGAPLRAPIVAMAATAAGRGYWLVSADGGVFAFGDAPFLTSLAGRRLNGSVSGIAVPAG